MGLGARAQPISPPVGEMAGRPEGVSPTQRTMLRIANLLSPTPVIKLLRLIAKRLSTE